MQMVADMRGVGVKNRGKFADVLCGRPLFQFTKKKSTLPALIRSAHLLNVKKIAPYKFNRPADFQYFSILKFN